MWIPIHHREFYDILRAIVVKHRGRTLFLDCRFDSDLDEYPDHFEVYELPSEADLDGSWDPLPELGKRLGRLALTDLVLDSTRRESLDSDSIEPFLGDESSERS